MAYELATILAIFFIVAILVVIFFKVKDSILGKKQVIQENPPIVFSFLRGSKGFKCFFELDNYQTSSGRYITSVIPFDIRIDKDNPERVDEILSKPLLAVVPYRHAFGRGEHSRERDIVMYTPQHIEHATPRMREFLYNTIVNDNVIQNILKGVTAGDKSYALLAEEQSRGEATDTQIRKMGLLFSAILENYETLLKKKMEGMSIQQREQKEQR